MTPTPQDKTAALEALKPFMDAKTPPFSDGAKAIWAHAETIRAAFLQPAWQGIGDKQPRVKKGMMRIYSFKPSSFRQGSTAKKDMLPRAYQLDTTMGYRECDLFMDVPLPPTDIDSGEG